MNNNTFFSATIDKVFYYVSFVLTTCFGPIIKISSIITSVFVAVITFLQGHYLVTIGGSNTNTENVVRDLWSKPAGVMIYITSLIKIVSGIQKLIGGWIQTKHRMMIS
jgi:hypothetical protein